MFEEEEDCCVRSQFAYWRTRPTFGGRRVLSPLRHPCTPPCTASVSVGFFSMFWPSKKWREALNDLKRLTALRAKTNHCAAFKTVQSFLPSALFFEHKKSFNFQTIQYSKSISCIIKMKIFWPLAANFEVAGHTQIWLCRKVGRGSGDKGRKDWRTWKLGDVGTWGRENVGAWGRGDEGTRGRGDKGTWRHGDVGIRGCGNAF